MDHSIIIQNYFKILPERGQIEVVKSIIEKYENYLIESKPIALEPLPIPYIAAKVIEGKAKPKDKRSKPRNTSRRIGGLIINGEKFDSPGAAFKKLGLNPSNFYARIRGMNPEEMQSYITTHIQNSKELEPKIKVIRRKFKG